MFPAAIPAGPNGEPFHAVIDPIAAKHDVTPQQIALAWHLHHTATSLPVPGTTSIAHLHENLDAASISLTQDEVDAITRSPPRTAERKSARPPRSPPPTTCRSYPWPMRST